jgi:murein DD-endopeptidase MepM/ murein hydrolase activator NlpD
MRARAIGIFAVGFLAGVLCLYYALWRTGSLASGGFLTLTSKEIADGVPPTPRPVPTLPPPTPTIALSLSGGVSPGASPSVSATPAPLPTPSLADFSLSGETLAMPVAGARRSDLHDSFAEARGGHRHEAMDILAPRGTPVLAVVDGTIAKLFTSARGGLTIYQFDRNAIYCYYYAHLDGYAEGLREGQVVRRGERIGSVGSTGDAPANTPHLHFTIFRLGPEKRWWQGLPVNPYPSLLAAAPRD